MLSLVVVLLAGAYAAELFTHEKVIDRVHNGVAQRLHLVILNDKAPHFGDKETMSNWASLHGIESINHYYAIMPWYQGFSAYLTPENVKELLGSSIVKFVEEDETISIDFTTEPQLLKAVTKVPANPQWRARRDWGQLRSSNRPWTLNTAPNEVFRSPPGPAIYGPPYAPVTNWTWKEDKPNPTPSLGEDYCIWVIDTGVYIRHDEFAELDQAGNPTGKSRVDLSVNFVATDNQTTDGNGHGTHCAGTAAGNYRGLAKHALIRSVRVLNNGGSGTWEAVIAGFNYVANNQYNGKGNIASVSLGGGGNQAVDDAVNAAVFAGVICVIAAGNSNNNACGTGGIGGNSPARAEQAITVVAVDSADNVASFSSYGPCCNSCAPGVTVTSAWISPTSAPNDTDWYNDISGTSMATPHVAGAIACRTKDDWIPDDVKADLGTMQTPGIVGGLTGVKAPTPNLYVNTDWKSYP